MWNCCKTKGGRSNGCVSTHCHTVWLLGDVSTRNSSWQRTCNVLSGTNAARPHLRLMATYVAATHSSLNASSIPLPIWCFDTENLGAQHERNTRRKWCSTLQLLLLQIQPTIIPSVIANQSRKTVSFISSLLSKRYQGWLPPNFR